jgi:hypothetical protein
MRIRPFPRTPMKNAKDTSAWIFSELDSAWA